MHGPWILQVSTKASNQAAFWLHPDHGCTELNLGKDLCGSEYAYMHLVCLTGETET